MKRIPTNVALKTLLTLIPNDSYVEIYDWDRYVRHSELVFSGLCSHVEWDLEDKRPLYSKVVEIDSEYSENYNGVAYNNTVFKIYICMFYEEYPENINEEE